MYQELGTKTAPLRSFLIKIRLLKKIFVFLIEKNRFLCLKIL